MAKTRGAWGQDEGKTGKDRETKHFWKAKQVAKKGEYAHPCPGPAPAPGPLRISIIYIYICVAICFSLGILFFPRGNNVFFRGENVFSLKMIGLFVFLKEQMCFYENIGLFVFLRKF